MKRWNSNIYVPPFRRSCQGPSRGIFARRTDNTSPETHKTLEVSFCGPVTPRDASSVALWRTRIIVREEEDKPVLLTSFVQTRFSCDCASFSNRAREALAVG
jgi:hypothetical protein